jgi:cysteine-rich repeat protein
MGSNIMKKIGVRNKTTLYFVLVLIFIISFIFANFVFSNSDLRLGPAQSERAQLRSSGIGTGSEGKAAPGISDGSSGGVGGGGDVPVSFSYQCGPFCGDGLRNCGEDGECDTADDVEDCDDGRHCANGDWCLSDNDCDDGSACEPRNPSEDGGDCPADCGSGNMCGNGIVDPGEECDDSCLQGDPDICEPGIDDGDGCNYLCMDEYCGDSIVQEGLGEECDDGNDIDGDGCSSSCQWESVCGDGIVEPPEECEVDDDCNLDETCSETCECELPPDTEVCCWYDDGQQECSEETPEQCETYPGGFTYPSPSCDVINECPDSCGCSYVTCGELQTLTLTLPELNVDVSSLGGDESCTVPACSVTSVNKNVCGSFAFDAFQECTGATCNFGGDYIGEVVWYWVVVDNCNLGTVNYFAAEHSGQYNVVKDDGSPCLSGSYQGTLIGCPGEECYAPETITITVG